jgi:hypothetical protein
MCESLNIVELLTGVRIEDEQDNYCLKPNQNNRTSYAANNN